MQNIVGGGDNTKLYSRVVWTGLRWFRTGIRVGTVNKVMNCLVSQNH
jgi:hypothetical protein